LKENVEICFKVPLQISLEDLERSHDKQVSAKTVNQPTFRPGASRTHYH